MLAYFPPRLFQEGCLILSNQYMGEGSLDNLKAMPKVFSLEENSDWAWEILLSNLGYKQHIASSYNQGKTAFTQTSLTSDWKELGCNMYTILCKDKPKCIYAQESIPCFFPLRILLHVVGDQPECCLLLSEHWYCARGFHPKKGTPNLISIEEKHNVVGEFLLFQIMEKQNRARSYS